MPTGVHSVCCSYIVGMCGDGANDCEVVTRLPYLAAHRTVFYVLLQCHAGFSYNMVQCCPVLYSTFTELLRNIQ